METRRVLLLVVQCGCIVSSNAVKDSNIKFTEHWVSKIKAFFDIVDMNGDGVVTKEEFIDLRAQRAQNILESWRAKAVYGIISHSYRTRWSNENTNYATSITFEELLPTFEKKIDDWSEAIDQSSWNWFHTFDLDCNDKLTVDEYSKFLTMFRNTAPVEDVFNAIDQDGNGSIDGEEFLNGSHHNWYDEAPNPGELIIGSKN
ncbi:sarcoplasmic calcium-binding protein-like [Lingula anatina]|uniref:Sarcoplasmic calcium-binding protein-like n=1 Tax=Lingula anatina TaxID=7574 RepID=A0A1S3HQC0_LINAN|nr:sarcoplasmic calcium-binding protein-like [Lingula anatina]|eukprot:XP_013387736.1 sarcoplasmic calcium-binding protein-like [Lingula anatina]